MHSLEETYYVLLDQGLTGGSYKHEGLLDCLAQLFKM